ncbi:MAG: hypothetical protein Q8P49_00380 [Candidatus Liptonbacteria bacterium]|nr:hypothetical protein [Candidatus Liptonbacteria bacterium]
MTYKCSKCGQASEQAGNCPNCNVPINEEAVPAEEKTVPSIVQPQESPSSEEKK